MEALISVIIPVYKVEKYLERCIDSVLAQTYQTLEIILVDDGSPDSCGSICDRYAQADSRIKVIHKENAGLGMARNSGLDICTGVFVMFVDSDDYLSADAVQVLYERLVRDGSDMAIGKHTDVWEDGRKNGAFCAWMRDNVIKTEDMIASIRGSQYLSVSAWGKLYKRDLFETLRYNAFKCAEDLMLYSSILDKCEQISVVDREVYYYFQRNDSIIHQKSEQAKKDELIALIQFSKYLWRNNAHDGALHWYLRSVGQIYILDDRKWGIALFKENFDASMEKKLLKRVGLKYHLKRKGLSFPVLFDVYRWIKKKMFNRSCSAQ